MGFARIAAAPAPRSLAFLPRPALARPGESAAFEYRLVERLRLVHGLRTGLEIRWSTGPSVGWSLTVVPGARRGAAQFALASAYPVGRLSSVRTCPTAGPPVRIGEPVHGDGRPFRTGADPPWSDTLSASFRRAHPGTSVRWRLTPLRSPRALETSPPPAWEGAILPDRFRLLPVSSVHRELQEARDRRSVDSRWAVTCEILGPADDRIPGEIGELISGAISREGGNGLRFRPVNGRARDPWPFVLSTGEISGLFASPWAGWAEPSATRSDAALRLRLGVDPHGFPVDSRVERGNGRHLVITGETGMGKSTLLVRLAVRAAALGSVVVFDPLGDSNRAILANLPESVARRAAWVAPSESPVPSDVLGWAARRPRAERERALEEIVAALRRVRSGRYPAAPYWGPRIEEVVHWAVVAAAELPQGTLRTAEQLLAGSGGRIPEGFSETAREALEAIRTRQRERPEEIEGARRLFSEVTRSAALRRSLAEPSAHWSIAEALRPGSVTLVSGDADRIGSTSATAYLSLQLAILWASIASRNEREPAFVFLDEAGLVGQSTIPDMLRLARHHGVGLLLATQSLAVLSEEVREAVLTNVSDFVLFRGSPGEAREFERWGTEVGLDRMVGLPRGRALVLLEKGSETRLLDSGPLPRTRSTQREEEARRRAARTPTGPSEGASGSLPSSGPGTGESSPIPSGFPSVVAYLRRCLDRGPGPEVDLDLRTIRSELSLSIDDLRRIGSRLAQDGVVQPVRSPGGPRWRVSRERLAEGPVASSSGTPDDPRPT